MIFVLLGIASAVLFTVGDIPYFLDTLKGRTKPHRVTWGMVVLLNAIGFANQYASGATNSLWLFGAGVIVTGAIFLASLKNGVGGESKMDIACLVISIIGVILWATLKSPAYSIIASAITDLVILVPTYRKTIKHPETETKISWLIGTISVGMATVSVGRLDWRLLILPLWSFILQLYMIYLLYLRPKAVTAKS
ncbi:MAG: hypothetical protein WDN66_05775 [Candidatus Saccharibacteria bacterium]